METEHTKTAASNEQEKPSYYWITTPNEALYKSLEIKSGKVSPTDTKEGLYYPGTGEGLELAKRMGRKIKEVIFCFNSTSKIKQGWITEEWLNAPIEVK